MAVKGITGDAHFFEESVNLEKIKKLLDNKLGSAGEVEKLEAMKTLLAMISKGEDVSTFFADVVKNVIVTSVEVKKMVYMYLVHYADSNAQCRELALLSINSFQKDLAAPNQLIRALALRVMTSIRVSDIAQIQLIAIRKCAADSSPYVRKCAVNAISKVHRNLSQNPLEAEDISAEIIKKLLNDNSTMVIGSAVQALHEVCPDRLDLLHGPFRKICNLLADIDEWGQIVTVKVLMRYCRQQFVLPDDPRNDDSTGSKKNKKNNFIFPSRKQSKKGFYSDDDSDDENSDDNESLKNQKSRRRNNSQDSSASSKPSPFYLGSRNNLPSQGSVFSSTGLATGIGGGEELDEDHRLLLRSSLPLLKSRNSGVVLAVAALHYYCGTRSLATITLIGKSLVRILRNPREVQYVVLSVISCMSVSVSEMFRPFLADFFVRATDPAYCRGLKLEILTSLVEEENVMTILREFQTYLRHEDKSFVTATVHALGRVADLLPSVSERILKGLMLLVHHSQNDQVVSESVVVIRQLLQRQHANLLLQNGESDDDEEDDNKKGLNEESCSELIRDLCGMLGSTTSTTARASIIWLLGEFHTLSPSLESLAPDVLRLLTMDFVKAATTDEEKLQILTLSVKLSLSQKHSSGLLNKILQYLLEVATYDSSYDIRDRARFIGTLLSSSNEQMKLDLATIFMKTKPLPLILFDQNSQLQFTLGSLSNMVKHNVHGYIPLSDWPKTQPDKSVRDPSNHLIMEKSDSESDRKNKKKNRAKHRKNDINAFYSDEESEQESLSSESSSGSSGMESDDTDNSDEESSTGESESSSEDSSDEESSEDEVIKKEEKVRKPSTKKSAPLSTPDLFDHFDFLSNGPPGDSKKSLYDDISALSLSSSQSTPNPTTNVIMSTFNNVTNSSPSMQNLSSSPPCPTATLLYSCAALDVRYKISRQSSMYSTSMNLVEIWFTNKSSTKISNIRLTHQKLHHHQSIIPFAEISVIPENSTILSQLHADFNGCISPGLEMELKFMDPTLKKVDVVMHINIGQCVRPLSVPISMETFEQERQALNPTLHYCKSIVKTEVYKTSKQRQELLQQLLAAIHVKEVLNTGTFAQNGKVYLSGVSLTQHPKNVYIALQVDLKSKNEVEVHVHCEHEHIGPQLLDAVVMLIKKN